MTERTCLRLTQHKRFVPYGTHPNPSLSLRTSFMLGTLYEMRAEAKIFRKSKSKIIKEEKYE